MARVKNTLVLGVGGLLMTLATAASAAVTLSLSPAPPNTGPQSASNPCIIAATNCTQPAGMTFTDFTQKGSVPSYDETSPTYTVQQLEDLGLTAFNVAIDVNTTGAASETLDLFEVWIGGTLAFVYDPASPGTLIGNISNNGNGFADWLLGVVDLSGFATNADIYFHAIWNNAVDGGESFFLIATSTPPPPPPGEVPEPSALLLVSLGLCLAALTLRRQRKTAEELKQKTAAMPAVFFFCTIRS